MDTTSYWIDSAPMPRHSPPTEDVSVDVVVIGGGITGITAAYLLKEAGCKVALVERAEFASIDTGHTTAHVTCVTDTSLTELARTFGDERARAVWDSGRAALDRMTDLIRREAIDCDFRWAPAWVHAPLGRASDDDVQTLRVEADTARRLGLSAQFHPRVPQYGAPGVGFPRQALFHPRKYLAALLRRIPGQGSHVFEGEPAEVTTADPLAVSVAGRRLRAADLVIATHNPLTGISGTTSAMLFQTKLSLYTSYALGARAPAGSLEEGSFWDTSDPYYYLRQDRHRDHDYAIFGGEDHKTGQETDTVGVYRKLEDAFRRYLPEARIDHRWSGQVIETNDGLPFIGRSEENQYVATGYAGNGMTFGTLAGLMVTDAITGRKNPWEELYDPHRKTVVGGTWAYLKENKDYPLYLVKNWLAKAEGESLESLRPNEGKILSLEGRKVAAFRADDGKVTLCSPVCTHLQCIVGWNPAERTWDCPCHGSRFQPTGEVISGPAEEPLERLDPPST